MQSNYSPWSLNLYIYIYNVCLLWKQNNPVIVREKGCFDPIFWCEKTHARVMISYSTIDFYISAIFENSNTNIYERNLNSLSKSDPLENRHFHFKTNQFIINSPSLSNKAPSVGIKILLRLNEYLSYVLLYSFTLFETRRIKL